MKFPHIISDRLALLGRLTHRDDGVAKAPWLIALHVFVLTVLAGGAAAYASMSETVDVTVEGKTETVRTFDDSVAEVLDSRGVKLADKDKVSVELGSAPDSDEPIVVEYAKPVTVAVDGEAVEEVTYAPTVGELLDEHEVEVPEGAYVSAEEDERIPRDGLEVVVSTPKKVSITADGQTQEFETTAPTVGEALEEAGVTLDEDDEVVPAAETLVTPDAALKVVRIVKEQRTEEVEVPFETETQEDPEAYEGEKTVVTEGVPGKATETVDIVTADGQQRDRVVVERVVSLEPVTQVEKVGTKERPAVDMGGVWGALAQCESGGNPATNTGNGFYGLYQFSASTWRAMGGSGLPSEASAEEQTMRAQQLQARSGWGQWPGCAAKLGLL
ncbi:MAG: ubiquitin-like domain-containing protein [Aeromicrobium sp.]|uniref:ubiquitin-like domain-containing protein n=1 Tax=Aeromicrobium sp. TaxID=1871063 RepID=UPI0039E3E67E